MTPSRNPRGPRRKAPARRPHTAGAKTSVMLWAPAAAALAGALASLPSLANGFARDDGELIPALLRGGRPILPLLAADFWAPAGGGSGLWRPFATLSLWIDGTLGGGSPLAFHAGNVLAHALATGALCALMLVCGLPAAAALAGALWFAVMPAHAEAVAWVVGRTDVLCALAAFAALALDRRARAGGGPALRIAAVAAYALALLAKESALGLVLVILALDSVALDSAAPDRVAPGTVTLDPAGARRTSFASSARWLAPYALVAVAWGFAHQAIGRAGGPPMYVSPGAPATWPAQAGLLLPHFAAALLPGVAHAPDALPRAWPGMVPAAILSAAALAAAAALAWRRSAALVPLTLFLAPLLPLVAAALAGKALPSGERLVYLASAGAAWALAMAVERATARGAGRAALLAAGALSAWSAVEYVRLQPAWKDDASVYEAMRRSQPANPVGWIGTADATAQRGDRAGAEALLARAAALGPDVPARHLVGAALHYRYGEWPAVVIAADSALALSPGLADVRVLRATALVRLRRLEEAELETRELLRERPDDPQVLAVEGQRLLLAGDAAGAALRLESAVSGAPDDVASWYSLGVARAITGRAGEAQQAFERTVALDPRYYQGWLALARAAAQAGDSAAATAALARAETLPEAAEARMRAQPGAR